MDINGVYAPSGAASYSTVVAGELTKTFTGAGLLHYLRACNTTASKIYVFLFDSLTAAGTLVCPPIPVAANDQVELKIPALSFSTGLTISASTTQTSYTAAGANALQVHTITKAV